MRITGLLIISPEHIPQREVLAIAATIEAADRAATRRIDHHGIGVERHLDGFFLNTALVLEDPRPEEVSPELWGLLSTAERQGCDWVLFDRDEPIEPRLPRFS